MLSPSGQSFLARIESDAGLGNIREHFGLAAGERVGVDAGALEVWQSIRDSVVSIIRELAPAMLTPETISDLRDAMHAALAQLYAAVDFPGPDVIAESVLTRIAEWSFDRAVKLVLGS